LKKSKILNIALTTVMLLSTVLTPQMSHALADMQAKDAERTSEVEETDVDVIKEESADDTNDNSGDGDSAEVVEMDSENEPEDVKDDPAPVEDDEVVSEEPEDVKANSPPVEENEREEENNSEADVDNESAEIETFNVEPQADLGNIFGFDWFRLDGVDVEDGDEVDFGQEYQIQYHWETDASVSAGDTASLELPDVFLEWSNTPNQDITLSDGTVVGKFTINNGVLEFTFDENIEGDGVQEGYVGFRLNFDREKFTEEYEQEIDFDNDGKRDLTVRVTPVEINTDLDKTGRTDSPVNAREVYWTVDLVNGADEAITNGTLADIIPDGLGEPYNFIVREITFDLDGNEIVGDIVDFNDPTLTDNGFEMTFDSVEGRSGYRVEYTTAIEDINVAQFTNEATFDAENTNLEAEATISGGERSNPIQKEGNRVWSSDDPEAGDQIEWTIIVNENGMSINDARVEDNLPDGLSVVPDSINITLNGESTDIEASEFPIELGAVSANETYRITFLTEINWGEVNGGDYLQNNGFMNTAILFDGEEELNDDDATVNWNRDPILEKVEAGNIDYENRTVTWEVTVNRAKHPLGDVTVTDQLPEGLSLTEINITGEDDEEFSGASYTDVDGLLTIELPDVGTETITIKYTTSIEDFGAEAFTNTVGMNGDGVGEGGGDREVTIRPHANTYRKNFAGINYEEKTINWRLNVNPTREDINEGFIITDTFTNDGLILLPDSVEIALGEENLVAGTDYTLNPIDDNYQNGFTIEFHREIANAELVVNFTTSYDEQFIDEDENVLIPHSNGNEEGLYRNHAHFGGTTENNREINEEDDASQRVREDAWNSGYKSGHLVDPESWSNADDRKIAWQVYFNYNQHNLGENVSVTDTLGYEGQVLEETIKVSVYDVDAEGNTTITDTELTSGEDYRAEVEGNEFTVTFNDEVTERYVIEFETTVQDISTLNYVNRAEVTTEKGKYPYSSSVHYNRWDNFLNKEVLPDVRNVYIGEELGWKITANESLSRIRNATLTDTISAGLSFVEDSFTVESSGDEEIDYTLETDTNEDGKTILNISFEDDLTEAITISYKTIVTAENNQEVNNTVDLNGTGIETITRETDEITATQFSWVGGEFREDRGAIEISKIDSRTGEIITDSEATFELYRVVNDKEVLMGAFTTENGILEVGNLFLGTYILREIDAPEGYRLSEDEITIEVDEAYGSNETVFEREFRNISDATINIPVEKEWEDANNQDGIRPESIEVKLLADGEETDADNLTLNAENNWKGTFTDLPELNEAGKVIIYTIEEVDVPEGYGSDVDGDMSEGFNITNSYTPEITEVSGTKEWDDANNQDGIRPESITVNLLANGAEVDDQVVTADEEGNWSYEFTGLPKYEAGEEITYTVTEDTVEDYTPAVDGHDIINSYTPEERSVTVTKTWDDANNQDGKRSESVDVQLFANGAEHGDPVTLSEENDWNHIWTELAVNAAGEEITYTIEELNVHEDYDVDINDENLGNVIITNSYTPEVTDVSGEKIWEDADNQDGVRPDEITVSLLANGEEIDSQDVTADDNWSYTFTDLPVYQPGEVGQEIEYTVVEAEIPEGYEVDYDGNNIINSYDPELVEVSITKEWNDEDNLAGFRPDQIEVELIADGEATGKVIAIVADEDGNWEGSFINLSKYRDEGIQIDYTVQEVSLDEDLYSVEVIPSDEDLYDFTLINTHEVERINLNGAKTWDDADNQDGVRPDSITVRLLANGKEVESSAVTDEIDWKFEFTNLPKYQNGEEINYTIQEDDVEGYSTEIEGMNIVNSYTPGQTSINVVKAWDDVQNQDGIRPESITVKLLADGKDTGQKLVLTAENNWQGDFIELDLYSNGELIKYTIEEIAVDGYEEVITGTSEDGFVITNTHRPEDPEEPGKETPDDPKGSEDSDDDSNLPKTGEAASYTLLALILVGLGFGLRYYSKRRTN